MSSSFFSTVTEVSMIDTRNKSGFVILPPASTIQGRLLRIKDTYGTALNSSITVQTTGVDLFENGLSTMVLRNGFDSMTLIAGARTTWHTLDGTNMPATNISSATISSLLLGSSSAVTAATALDVRGQTTMNLIQPAGIWVAGGQPGSSTIYTSTDAITWTLRSCPITGFVYSVANNGTLWVAVGTTGATIATSPDGITWTARPNSLTTGRTVVWNGSIWLVGGIAATGAPTILSSPDGITWTGQNGFLSICYDIIWNGSLFVAVGVTTQGSTITTIITSTDGLFWVIRPNGFTTAAYTVVWTGSLWIAGGESASGGPLLQTSVDGITWFPRQVGFTGSVRSLAWNGNLILAGGTGTVTLQRSTDGITWTTCINNISGTTFSLAWNGSLWFAGGQSGTSGQSSPDGVTWTNRGTNLSVTFALAYSFNTTPTASIGNLSFYNYGLPNFLSSVNQYAALTSSIAINNTLYVDKINRVGINTGNPQAPLDVNGQLFSHQQRIGTTPTPGIWLAGGSNSSGVTIQTSFDGINWFTRPNSITGITNGVAWNGSYFVAVGVASVAGSSPIIQTSSNGYVWTNQTAQNLSLGPLFCVATNGPLWVIGGAQNTAQIIGTFGGTAIQTSTDGSNWTARPNTPLTQVNGVAWNGSLWVAVGLGILAFATGPFNAGSLCTIQTSTDGITWTGRMSGFTIAGQGIAWNGSLWVAVGVSSGGAGSCYIQTSPDGINWTNRPCTFTAAAYSVAWNGSLWLVGGQGTNTLVSSPDGITWTVVSNGTSTAIYSIAWNGSLWVTNGVGGSIIQTSIDGVSWVGRGTAFTSGFSVCFATFNIPTIAMSNLNVFAQGQPSFLTCTNQIVSYISAMTLNNTLTVDQTNRVGINLARPQFALDVNGYANFTGLRTNVYGTTNLYVAVGSNAAGTVTVQTSVDAVTWYSRVTNFALGRTNAIGWNGTMLIALSSEGGANIQTSFDGFSWTTRTGNYSSTQYANCIGWNGSVWVTGGTGGMISTSPDGITWTSRGNGFTANGIINAVVWSGLQWVAVGTQYSTTTLTFTGFIQTSPDGFTWTTRPTHPFSTSVNGVAWNGDWFVAVGSGSATIATSADGIIWVARANPFTVGTCVAWSGFQWAAGGSNYANILTSPDGINWTPRSMSITNVATITWAGNQWLAGGSGGQTLITSVDGITWSARGNNFGSSTGACLGFVYMNPNLPNVAMSSINIYAYGSPNYLSNANQIMGLPSSLALNNTLYVNQQNLVGINTGNPQAALDVNGATRTLGLTTNMLALSNWVAVGSNAGGTIGIIQSSSNGTTWSSNTNAFTVAVNCIAWNDSYFLAGGQGTQTMQISYDGIAWSNITNGFGTTTGTVNGLGWNGQTWVAVGAANGPVAPFIQTSSNGTSWTTQTSAFTVAGRCVGWNGYLWVVGGQGTQTIQTSSNATTWVSQANNITGACFGAAWNGQLWVAVGSNAAAAIIQTSSNATTWTTQTHAFTTSVNAVAWNGIMFVAVGQGTVTLQTSLDGITWTTRTNNFGTSGNSIAWNGRLWIAGGSGGILQTSPDGVTWTSRTNNVSTITGIAYTNFLAPNIGSSNLNIYSHGQPNFITSTNQIVAYESTIGINDTLYVDQQNLVTVLGSLNVTGGATVSGRIQTGVSDSVTLGNLAGATQLSGAIAIGKSAGANQQASSVAIGQSSGGTQLLGAIALGHIAASGGTQGESAVAIGYQGGQNGQGTRAVAIGRETGRDSQGAQAVAIGALAGMVNQAANTVAIGNNAGTTSQSTNSVAIGFNAGNTNQHSNAVAIGFGAGQVRQSTNTVAIGYNAGNSQQGLNAVAIGTFAGQTNQASNSIIINASGSILDNTSLQGFFVAPVRSNAGTFPLTYNTTTSEISYAPGSVTGVNSAGNIGINSASNTSNALFVNGTQSNTGALYIGGSANITTPGAAIMSLANSSNANQLTIVGGIVTSTNYAPQAIAGDSVIRSEGSAGLCLAAGDSGGLRIAPTTNIITTTSNVVVGGTLTVNQGTTFSGNVGIFVAPTVGTQLDILGGSSATGFNSNLISFQFGAGGYRHFLVSRHNNAGAVNTNAIDFWINTGTTQGASSTAGTNNANTLSITATGIGISNLTPATGYALDVNGPSQSAIFYSAITSGGTTTITPSNFGVFYNITVTGTYTLAFSASQPSSNIGKYVCFRNNTGGTLSLTLTGVSGIASPLSLANAQSATIVVATTSTYALF
jgi:hypothetical protein